ncbi:helix-turn-helix domain-containing protein [Pseudonocardia sulfidoxydans]|uniref:helix-turn-helix domain-containing protein n=1 Tax=Pseudonocardia sulfidoxydans TaxID=54011 RepID=UPI0035E7D493
MPLTGTVRTTDSFPGPLTGRGTEHPQRMSVDGVLALLRSIRADTGPGRGVAGLLAHEDLPSDVLATLEDEVLRVRGTVTRMARREHELSALFSSARELAEEREPALLLRRLVQRAHDLLGTDVAYVASFEQPSGVLVIHEAVGSVTPELMGVRVPPGKGLAMKVAQSRAACRSTRYMQDHGIEHDDEVDAVIDGEGIVSMVGVPMLAGDDVVGVLVAANRSVRTFSTEEIALLSAFADHASVVLQTARLLDEAVVSAAAAEQACAELTRQTSAMERTAAVHSELTAAVLRGGSAQEVADILGGVLRRRITILDRRGTPLADSGGRAAAAAEPLEDGERTGFPAAIRAALRESRRTGQCVPLREGASGLAVAVVAGESLMGAILVDDGEIALTPADRRTVERASQIVALLTLRQEAVADAEERVRGELVSDLLGARSVYRHELLLRARSRGIRIDELRTPVVVIVDPEHRRAALRAAHDIVPGGLAGEHEGTVVVLLSEAPGSAADLVRTRLAATLGCPLLVVAGPAGTPESLADRFDLARRCARLLGALGRTDTVATTDGYAPYLALFGSGREDLGAFISQTLGPVIDWDAERGTDLVATLLGFVEANASPTRTARNLGLHTNTVLQRLDRITTLLGESWRDAEPLFRISIAARLHQLAAVV